MCVCVLLSWIRAERHVLAEVVLCAVGRVAPLPADGDDGAKHCLARAGDEQPGIYKTSTSLSNPGLSLTHINETLCVCVQCLLCTASEAIFSVHLFLSFYL